MRRKIHLSLLAAVILAGLALTPRPAEAQWRGHRGTRVVVGFGWGYPYWGWGYPYWGWGWGWGYPYWGWGYPYGYGQPRAAYNSAELKLEVKPKDAQVYVDGYYVGIVDDFDGTFQRLRIPPGEHEIVIYKPGFRTIKQSIRVRARQDSKIKYAMQQLPAGETAEAPPQPPPQPPQEEQQQPPPQAPRGRGYGYGGRTPPQEPMPPPERPMPPGGVEARGFGTLVCRVQPAGAEILVDGERWQTPQGEERLVVQLAEGPHRVEIRKDGYVTYTSEITVRQGETTPLNVSLPPRQ